MKWIVDLRDHRYVHNEVARCGSSSFSCRASFSPWWGLDQRCFFPDVRKTDHRYFDNLKSLQTARVIDPIKEPESPACYGSDFDQVDNDGELDRVIYNATIVNECVAKDHSLCSFDSLCWTLYLRFS